MPDVAILFEISGLSFNTPFFCLVLMLFLLMVHSADFSRNISSILH